VARAQSADRMRCIGVLMSTDESDPIESASVRTFAAALEKLGWAQGRNLEMMIRWAAGDPQRMEANARELVRLAPVALLVKGANVPAAQRATATIPIVFVVLGDANAETYVGSFARRAAI
jgi:putative tryptophan/tyrosine transport system substrate-binding protein